MPGQHQSDGMEQVLKERLVVIQNVFQSLVLDGNSELMKKYLHVLPLDETHQEVLLMMHGSDGQTPINYPVIHGQAVVLQFMDLR